LSFRRVHYLHSDLNLEVYPIFILQLTTLSLLFSLTSSAVAVMPAMVSPATTPQPEVVEVAKEIKAEDYMPISDSKNIERFVTDYFADIPVMIEVAKCESRFRHLNSSGEVLRGDKNKSDRGVMQINLYYHAETAAQLGLDVHNLDDNVAYARHLYEKQGVRPWNSSSPCWSKTVLGSEIARR
jgi:hypothetical protein